MLWAICEARPTILARVSGTVAGCGCGSTVAEIFFCEKFGEPVLKQAAPRCFAGIQRHAPGYTGRTCVKCDSPQVSDFTDGHASRKNSTSADA